MASREEDITGVLIQIAGDIGQTREGIVNLKNSYTQVVADVGDIKRRLSDTVKVTDCANKHKEIETSLSGLQTALVTEIRSNSASGEVEFVASSAEKAVRERDRRRKSVTYWLTVSGAIVGLLGTLVIGSWKLVSFTKDVNDTMLQTRQQLSDEIGQTKRHVVYVQVPVYPDAGVEPVTAPTFRKKKVAKKPR